MKSARRILLVVLAIAVIAGLVVYLNLNRIVRRTIETQATHSLTLQTRLDSARLSLFGGKLTLGDLTIASPQGYDAPHMLALDSGTVQVSYGELNDDPVRIQSMTLNRPKLVIEQSQGKFNFQVLSDLVSQTPPDRERLRVVIDRLTIQEASVVLRPGLPGLEQEIVVAVPTVELSNVGTGEGAQNGAAIKDVVMEVISALAAKSGNANIPEQLKKQLEQGAEQLAQQVSAEARKQIERITERVDEQLGGTGVNIGDVVSKELDQGLSKTLGSEQATDAEAGERDAKERKQRNGERP
jgi:uncharacterized protein involved in outer membrane biogenesis